MLQPMRQNWQEVQFVRHWTWTKLISFNLGLGSLKKNKKHSYGLIIRTWYLLDLQKEQSRTDKDIQYKLS